MERDAQGELQREAHHVVGDCPRILEQETAFDGDGLRIEARLVQHLSEQSRRRRDVFAQHGDAEAEEIGAQRRRDRAAERLHREGKCRRVVARCAAHHRPDSQRGDPGVGRRLELVARTVDTERDLAGVAESCRQQVQSIGCQVVHRAGDWW